MVSTGSTEEFDRLVDDCVARKKTRVGEIKPFAMGRPGDNWPYSNRLASEDLIRHYVDALGDENPLFRSHDYCQNTRYGQIIAPPTFLTCIAPTFTADIPEFKGWHSMNGGSSFEFYRPVYAGDTINGFDTYLGIEEKARRDRPYRLFIDRTRRTYVNQRGETVGQVESRFVVVAAPSDSTAHRAPFPPMPTHSYSVEEQQKISDAYHAMNEQRRGGKPRYWEDVAEGDPLPGVVQGPIDVTDQVAMFSATGHICKGFGIKWKQVTSNPWYPLAPEWNVQICGAEVHLSSEHAQIVGYPTAVSLAIVLEGGVSQMICNWMGDEGFLKKLDCASRHPMPLGYTNWITGKVVKKYQAGEEGLVDIEGECRDQNGALAMPSTATLRLPRRTVVPK